MTPPSKSNSDKSSTSADIVVAGKVGEEGTVLEFPFGPEGLGRALLAEARGRVHAFGKVRCYDLQWLILLDLFVAGQQGRDTNVRSLCMNSGVPTTTAARLIPYLKAEGMIDVSGPVTETEQSLVVLTDNGRRLILEHLRSTMVNFRGDCPQLS